MSCQRNARYFIPRWDFQLALFRHINEKKPDCQVRLEKPFRFDGKAGRVDIWLPGEGVAIELKHFTQQMAVCHAGELFALKDQAASNLARYGFLTDVQRLEHIVQDAEQPALVGFAVLLTNAPALWNQSSRRNNDAAFRLYDGRDGVTGKLQWSKGSTPIEDRAIHLRGSYTMHWKPYSNFKYAGGKFRYLTVSVAGLDNLDSSGRRPVFDDGFFD